MTFIVCECANHQEGASFLFCLFHLSRDVLSKWLRHFTVWLVLTYTLTNWLLAKLFTLTFMFVTECTLVSFVNIFSRWSISQHQHDLDFEWNALYFIFCEHCHLLTSCRLHLTRFVQLRAIHFVISGYCNWTDKSNRMHSFCSTLATLVIVTIPLLFLTTLFLMVLSSACVDWANKQIVLIKNLDAIDKEQWPYFLDVV